MSITTVGVGAGTMGNGIAAGLRSLLHSRRDGRHPGLCRFSAAPPCPAASTAGQKDKLTAAAFMIAALALISTSTSYDASNRPSW